MRLVHALLVAVLEGANRDALRPLGLHRGAVEVDLHAEAVPDHAIAVPGVEVPHRSVLLGHVAEEALAGLFLRPAGLDRAEQGGERLRIAAPDVEPDGVAVDAHVCVADQSAVGGFGEQDVFLEIDVRRFPVVE